jgi:hypothetical protein
MANGIRTNKPKADYSAELKRTRKIKCPNKKGQTTKSESLSRKTTEAFFGKHLEVF